jgi:hypothetical protein
MKKMIDREKLVQILKFYLETNRIVREKVNPEENMVRVDVHDIKDVIELLTAPVGTYYDYGETDCKACGCPVDDSIDRFCPNCGRLLYGEEGETN